MVPEVSLLMMFHCTKNKKILGASFNGAIAQRSKIQINHHLIHLLMKLQNEFENLCLVSVAQWFPYLLLKLIRNLQLLDIQDFDIVMLI